MRFCRDHRAGSLDFDQRGGGPERKLDLQADDLVCGQDQARPFIGIEAFPGHADLVTAEVQVGDVENARRRGQSAPDGSGALIDDFDNGLRHHRRGRIRDGSGD